MELKSKVGPLTAIVLTTGAVMWMLSGGNGITRAQADNNTATSEASGTPVSVSLDTKEVQALKQVQAKTFVATSMASHIALTGVTLASDTLNLSAGASGKVTKIHYQKGDTVTKGSVILSTDTRALVADIEQTKALLKQRELELSGAEQLKQQRLSSDVALASSRAAVAQVRASLKKLQIELENANLIAPFTGVLNELHVSETQLITAGMTVGQLVALNPLKITANVPQKSIDKINIGTTATIKVNDLPEMSGQINFISAQADSGTRSLAIEILLDNPENTIPAGVTAEVDLSLPDQTAHGFSPALLTLDANGHTAVKTLDIDNKVLVTPVSIIKSERDQVWVTGLPRHINIITVGQGFTNAGEIVIPHFDN